MYIYMRLTICYSQVSFVNILGLVISQKDPLAGIDPTAL